MKRALVLIALLAMAGCVSVSTPWGPFWYTNWGRIIPIAVILMVLFGGGAAAKGGGGCGTVVVVLVIVGVIIYALTNKPDQDAAPAEEPAATEAPAKRGQHQPRVSSPESPQPTPSAPAIKPHRRRPRPASE